MVDPDTLASILGNFQCYLEKLAPKQVVKFSYRLRAKFPMRAQTPKSTAYEYYNPDNRADAEPVAITVE